ncbi:MAG: sugar transferase [Candidatus Pseudobacter hemicellulosilyticus]|uniref:Sugar transferase n=1 Tax=Candidatus Pseudobacter hemicellulosilyticus TaxID=3121375 RepID=A0AAJ6BKG7_9BACT|nr:MAG: sugar transferase [Pseudobacter sp.]
MTTYSEIQSLGKKAGHPDHATSFRLYVTEKRKYLIFKRIFDVVLSSLVIIFLLSWLVPILALLIKLDSSGPVFFIQRRVGRWGKSFKCLKFRTMVVNDDANTRQASENDSRITRLGNFLRHSNLDELPQFFNVLVGDMSVVGPRPHMHADCNKFAEVISSYKFRHMVRPGITGLAQVKGYRGPTRNFESIFHRYQFDAFYVRNANFWLDVRIIRKTAGQTIQHLLAKFSDNAAASVQSPIKPVTGNWTAPVKHLN